VLLQKTEADRELQSQPFNSPLHPQSTLVSSTLTSSLDALDLEGECVDYQSSFSDILSLQKLFSLDFDSLDYICDHNDNLDLCSPVINSAIATENSANESDLKGQDIGIFHIDKIKNKIENNNLHEC